MAKKLFILILTLSMLFTVASANNSKSLMLEAEDITSASAGETVAISIFVRENPGIAVIAFDVDYDSDYITLRSAEHSDEVFKKNNFTLGDLSKKPYKVLALNANGNRTDDGKLLSLNFFIKEDCPDGVYKINLTNAECYTHDEEEVICENIVITIKVNGAETEGNTPVENPGDTTEDKPEDNSGIAPEEKPEDSTETTSPDSTQNITNNSSSSGSQSTGSHSRPTTSGGSSAKLNTQDKKEEVTSSKKQYTAEKSIILTIGRKDASVFGSAKANDVAPILRNSRTMLPARFVAESLDAVVKWFENERKVLITKGETEIVIYVDSQKAYVNGKEEILDSPAFIENNRTYTPLRFVAENLGAKVYWEADTQNVIIEKT